MMPDVPDPAAALEQELARDLRWLNCRSAALERAFRDHYFASGRVGRFLLFFTPMALFATAPLYDGLLFDAPGDFEIFLRTIEFALIVPALLLAALSCVLPTLHRFSDALSWGAMAVVPTAIALLSATGIKAGFTLPAYLGTVLIVGVFVLGRLPFFATLAVGVVAFAIGAGAEVAASDDVLAARFDVYAQTILFVVGAAGGYVFELTYRRSWLQTQLLEVLSSTDPLTGLMNRRALEQAFGQLWRQAQRDQRPVLVAVLDIDAFKPLNDHYGHDYGDRCLRAVAQCLARQVRRPLDLCARVGGEEFVLAWFDCDTPAAKPRCEQVLADVAALGLANEKSRVARVVTISAGAVWLVPDAEASARSTLRHADALLYEAKRRGRNRVVFELEGETS